VNHTLTYLAVDVKNPHKTLFTLKESQINDLNHCTSLYGHFYCRPPLLIDTNRREADCVEALWRGLGPSACKWKLYQRSLAVTVAENGTVDLFLSHNGTINVACSDSPHRQTVALSAGFKRGLVLPPPGCQGIVRLENGHMATIRGGQPSQSADVIVEVKDLSDQQFHDLLHLWNSSGPTSSPSSHWFCWLFTIILIATPVGVCVFVWRRHHFALPRRPESFFRFT
jgi:hypothetical protein